MNPETVYQIVVDDNGIVTTVSASNILADDAIEVDEATYLALQAKVNRATWNDGEIADLPEQALPAPRSVAMWRARTIMKVTPWEGGTLFDAVQSAVEGLTDPLQKASSEEALERGDVFDRNGVLVPLLAGIVAISDEQLDDLMEQAAALPA